MDQTEPKLKVIIFSKDRPWQLKECLRTMQLHLQYSHIEYHVLYVPSEGYEEVIYNNPSVNFHIEQNFAQQIIDLVKDIEYVMFCVDDALFYNDVPIEYGLNLMGDTYWAWYTKLYNKISICHPAKKSHSIPKITDLGENIGSFDIGDVPYEWSYPWCLSGTIYHKSVALGMIQSIYRVFGIDGISHPNKLEAHGYMLLMNDIPNVPSLCMYNTPVMSIVTVNRVQDFYKNPTYDSDIKFPQSCLKRLEYNIDYYSKQSYPSVHIGDVNIKQVSENECSCCM